MCTDCAAGRRPLTTVVRVTPTSSDTASGLTLRTASDADWDQIFAIDARAFVMRNPLPDDERADLRGKVEDSDVRLVFDEEFGGRPGVDGAPLVGVSMFYRMSLTVPGGHVAQAAGLSWVSVAATHRRRGILRRMITSLFDQWEAEGQPFAILTASEATIYQRFGFGPACFSTSISVDLGRARMRADDPEAPSVRYATSEEVRALVPDLHARWTATRPGAVHRSPAWWKPILADRHSQRPPGTSQLHYILHADGYACYRVNTNDPVRGEITEFCAITDEAHRELWRVLTGLDLMHSVVASVPTDDPLPAALTDLRSVRVTGMSDKMWLRILDIPKTLGMRHYQHDLDVVIEVTDKFRGHGGVFDLSVRNGGGIVAPGASSATPTVRLDISDLASLYLGGVRARTYAATGRLWTDSPETLAAFDAAFATPVAPFSGTFF